MQQSITDFMHKKLNNKHLNIKALYNILSLMFSTNVFTYKNSFHKQIKGLGMGCIAGPSVANIYVYILERNWVYIHRPSQTRIPVNLKLLEEIFKAAKKC